MIICVFIVLNCYKVSAVGGGKKAEHSYAMNEIIEVFLKYCILKKCTA